MNTDKLFHMHGKVDVKTALNSFRIVAGNKYTIEELNESSLHGVLYLDKKGVPIRGDRKKAEQLGSFKIIPTCVYNKSEGRQVCASFRKEGITWVGVYVATLHTIITRLQEYHIARGGSVAKSEIDISDKCGKTILLSGYTLDDIEMNNRKYSKSTSLSEIQKDIEDTGKLKHTSVITSRTTEIYNDIYDMLLIKENWKSGNKNRLYSYIKTILEKVTKEQSKNESLKGNGYTLSRDRSKCVINTGLMDSYSNDIYLIDVTNNEKNVLNKKLRLYVSKSNLVELGFNREDISELPKMIKFYSNKADLIFSARIDDFDLEASDRLNHIIVDRRGRFPAEYRDVSCDIMCSMLKSAVSKAVSMSERDYRYVVPMYNIKEDTIQYLMPLHLSKSIEETPELVVVVGEYNGFYNIYTILNTDDAYDNARILCRPDHTWLRV